MAVPMYVSVLTSDSKTLYCVILVLLSYPAGGKPNVDHKCQSWISVTLEYDKVLSQRYYYFQDSGKQLTLSQ